MPITFEGPAIFVSDMQASRAFYEDLLEQEVLADFGANVPFKSGFSLWEARHAVDVIYQGRRKAPQTLGRDNVEYYFETPDLDAVWAKVEREWKAIIHPIAEAPWGQRGFRVHDPDGHVVEVGEPLTVLVRRLAGQGLSFEEISGRTSIPVEMVAALHG